MTEVKKREEQIKRVSWSTTNISVRLEFERTSDDDPWELKEAEIIRRRVSSRPIHFSIEEFKDLIKILLRDELVLDVAKREL